MMTNKLTIFDVAGRSMAAQQVRLNTVASNLANAASVSGSPDTVYRPIKPVFETQYHDVMEKTGIATVDVTDISQSTAPPEKRYAPNHPLADKDGYIFAPAIDQNAEMIDMLETSRQYQNNIEVLSTAKTLLIKTLNVGK
jgi:flagellar basal-body rod protein FlgC